MASTQQNITCYGYNYVSDNAYFTDNVKCTDSDSCCGTLSACQSNRLCKSASGVLVRPSCANFPWTLNSCAQICLYDNVSGFVPRVNVCPDGSYCCDNNPNCCLDKSGVFLNENGVVTGRANETSSSSVSSASASSTSASSTSSSTPASTTTSVVPTPTSSPPPATSSNGLSSSTKVGLGVGLSLGVMVLLAIIFALWSHRRRSQRDKAGNFGSLTANSGFNNDNKPEVQLYPAEMENNEYRVPLSELPATPTLSSQRN